MIKINKVSLYEFGGDIDDSYLMKEIKKLKKIERGVKKWVYAFIAFVAFFLVSGVLLILMKGGIMEKEPILFYPTIVISLISCPGVLLSMFKWAVLNSVLSELYEKIGVLVFINTIKDKEKAEKYRRLLL